MAAAPFQAAVIRTALNAFILYLAEGFSVKYHIVDEPAT
jgi:hypothetical protein